LFTLGVFFEKITEAGQIFNCDAPQKKFTNVLILAKKMVVATFWAIFHKLIWSPWQPAQFNTFLFSCSDQQCSFDNANYNGDQTEGTDLDLGYEVHFVLLLTSFERPHVSMLIWYNGIMPTDRMPTGRMPTD
jgi:hypothetical protein